MKFAGRMTWPLSTQMHTLMEHFLNFEKLVFHEGFTLFKVFLWLWSRQTKVFMGVHAIGLAYFQDGNVVLMP